MCMNMFFLQTWRRLHPWFEEQEELVPHAAEVVWLFLLLFSPSSTQRSLGAIITIITWEDVISENKTESYV